MVEIVKNVSYGGFGLSNKAITELIKMNSETMTIRDIGKHYVYEGISEVENIEDFAEIKSKNDVLSKKTIVENFNKVKINNEDYYIEERSYSGNGPIINFNKGEVYSTFDIDTSIEKRSHPDLIKVVRELGDDANSYFSDLVIVDVPRKLDEIYISSYDGKETIREKHETW